MNFRMTAAALGALLFAVPANATYMLLTFTGHVGDTRGTMPFGGTLPGAAYVATFLIDTAAPHLAANYAEGSSYSHIAGGTGYGLPADTLAVDATMTINGVSVRHLGDYVGDIQYADITNPPGSDSAYGVQAWALSNSGYGMHLGGGSNYIDFMPSGHLTAEFDWTVPSAQVSDQSYFQAPGGALMLLRVETISAARSSLPEPSNWAMMIAGFGMAGATLRRRRVAAEVIV